MKALIICAVFLAASPVAAQLNWYAQQELATQTWAIERQTDAIERQTSVIEDAANDRKMNRYLSGTTGGVGIVGRSTVRVRRPVVMPRYNFHRSRYSYRNGWYGGRGLSSHRNFYGGYSVYIRF